MKPYYKNELTTIYNGDCLEVMDYLIEQNIKVDAIITDPPYGTTACKWDNVIPFDKMWERLKKLRKDKTPVVLFGSEPFSSHLRLSNINEYKYDWIWEKQKASNFMAAKYQPLKYHEIVSVFETHKYTPIKYKVLELKDLMNMNEKELNYVMKNREYDKFGKVDKRKTINNPITNKNHIGNKIKRTRSEDTGYRYPKSVLKINKSINKNLHPTQKPVALLQYLIKTYTKENDLILDFTSGSFTTCVAAEQLNRRSIGIEKEKKYCDIGIKRLNELQLKFDI